MKVWPDRATRWRPIRPPHRGTTGVTAHDVSRADRPAPIRQGRARAHDRSRSGVASRATSGQDVEARPTSRKGETRERRLSGSSGPTRNRPARTVLPREGFVLRRSTTGVRLCSQDRKVSATVLAPGRSDPAGRAGLEDRGNVEMTEACAPLAATEGER